MNFIGDSSAYITSKLFLPWFLTTCVSGILGNRADAKFVSVTKNISDKVQVGKIINHDMQKALNPGCLKTVLNYTFGS